MAAHENPMPSQLIATMIEQRNYNRMDRAMIALARAMDTLGATSGVAVSDFPAEADEAPLSAQERRLAGRYMRVNHVGEVCAQALYRSQALTARDRQTRERMRQAAAEENDHLAWCEQRLTELGARKSLLNPLWGLGAFAIGGLAGLAGDRWNLGFVAETERQVVEHLESHLGKLPPNDTRSRQVVARMQADERAHAEAAIDAGGADLPPPVKGLMRLAARAMTSVAHWI